MKTAIIKPTEELRNLVLFTRQFMDSVEVESFDEIKNDKKIEVLLTEKNNMSPNDIIHVRQRFPDHKIIILSDDEDQFFQKSCIAHDVLLVSKNEPERKRLDYIQKMWFGLEEQTEFHNVIAIHGTHRQVGVTQLALSIGLTLGTFKYKTLVIGLNPYNPGELTNEQSAYSFEQVYDLIQNKVIYSGESLMPYLTKVEQFYYLVGNRDFYKAMQFEQKPVEQLIHFAKEYFDIVILDIGSFYDNFLPLVGLGKSNTHVLVSSQEQLSLDEYKRWKEQVLNRFDFYPKNTYQIVNKFASKAILTAKQLEETHQVSMLARVPFFPEANDAVIEDGILMLADYGPFTRVIEGLSKAIVNEVTEVKYKSRKRGVLKSIFTRGK